MASNPLVLQGTLNRIRGNVVIATYPQLNVTAGYLGKEGISFQLEGEASQLIGTLTGAIPSPEPYQYATVTVHLLRTQSLSQLYLAQMLVTTNLGNVTVFPDTDTIAPFVLLNAVISSVQEMPFNGTNPEMVVRLRGTYVQNALMWASG